jgi:hypothetical protein
MIELDPKLVAELKKRTRKIKRESDEVCSNVGATAELEQEHLHILMENLADQVMTMLRDSRDDLSSDEIKETRSELSQLLHRIMNDIIKEDVEPKKWRLFRGT